MFVFFLLVFVLFFDFGVVLYVLSFCKNVWFCLVCFRDVGRVFLLVLCAFLIFLQFVLVLAGW